jgi:hypothetical protein
MKKYTCLTIIILIVAAATCFAETSTADISSQNVNWVTETWGETPDADHRGVTEDTYVDLQSPDSIDFSTDPFLNRYTWSEDSAGSRIFMKWDLSAIPPNATIIRAKLHLYYDSEDYGGGDERYEIPVAKVINTDSDILVTTWDTDNPGGIPLADPKGYKIYFDDDCPDVEGMTIPITDMPEAQQPDFVIDVGNATAYTIPVTTYEDYWTLANGGAGQMTYCFAVTAYDEAGNESARSKVMRKTFIEHVSDLSPNPESGANDILPENTTTVQIQAPALDDFTPGMNGQEDDTWDLALPEDTVTVGTIHGYYKWDVTDMVQEWVRGTALNIGMALSADDEASADSNRYFASSDHLDPNKRPKLVITYVIPDNRSIDIPPENSSDPLESIGVTHKNKTTLTWKAPVKNIDGTPLRDLAGFRIYYGTSSFTYTRSIDVKKVTQYTLQNLPQGTWYFAVTAYDSRGNESQFSNQLKKSIE